MTYVSEYLHYVINIRWLYALALRTTCSEVFSGGCSDMIATNLAINPSYPDSKYSRCTRDCRLPPRVDGNRSLQGYYATSSGKKFLLVAA
jgi:hypothetical protein